MTPVPGLAAVQSVMPLPHTPATAREWAAKGLPEHGWVMITDQASCASCKDMEACSNGCISVNGLPREAREHMGTCAQCDPAVCAWACPVDAITHNAMGVVTVDQELCVGCHFCEDECPNGALLFVDPFRTAIPPYGVQGYKPGQPTGQFPHTVAKCTFCTDRLLDGHMPACADACSEGAKWVGNLDRDTATNGHVVVRLSELLGSRRFGMLAPGQRVIELY